MESEKTIQPVLGFSLKAKLADYAALAKLRLASLVVYSAGLGYGIALLTAEVFPLDHKMDYEFSWQTFLYIILGGFLVTGSSNGFNQVIERESDAKMSRTENRPIPAGRMSVTEGLIVSSILGIIGLYLLYEINQISFALGLVALVSYVAIYTPLKKMTPISVFVGAFPGAFPPMLGWVAATGSFSVEAGILFAMQFVWQFPHFWAIAWKINDQYSKAGFKMLPFGKKDKRTATIILLSSLALFAASILPEYIGFTGRIATVGLFILSALMVYPAIKLVQTLEDKFALRIMLMSYLYLILSLTIILIDKV